MKASWLLGLAWVGMLAHAQEPPAALASFKLEPLAPGVYAAIDQGGRAGANAGVIIGSEAIAIVDSFYRPEATRALLAEVRKLSKLPLRYVVNTHHHIDHVAGNAVLAAEGALIVSQRHVAGWQHSENQRLMGERAKPGSPGAALIAALPEPQLSYTQALELQLGGRKLLLRHYPGHTGGDTVVSVPDAQVVFAGDLFWRHAIPNLVDARTGDWVATLERLTRDRAGTTRFVPGHGEVGGSADVNEFRAYLATLRELADRAWSQGLRGSEAEAQVLKAVTEGFGDWAHFKGLAAANARDALAERAGSKRVPLPLAEQD
ncbi:MBL fold metallo-hydrolase [Paucibacter soli]|uniref:MBL fold metallo-hydrolase n=1 Tax=Paucibacter soli TaxID=3133433 RepID=UPI0030AB59AE